MDESLYGSARKTILRKLMNMRKWGGSHTHFKHMLGGLPKHLRGSKEVKKAIKDLIREQKLLTKQTLQEPHVSLNPAKAKEIKDELGTDIT